MFNSDENTVLQEEKGRLLKPQKYLGKTGTIIFISVMNMFVPLSIDMYLPALPTMTSYFNTSSGLVNLTLVGFFFFFAVGILLFGPLSDRFGRKPVLLAGVILYTVFSCACAAAGSIFQLIIFRIFQSLGAGSMISVSTALIKDCFDGRIRERVLALVQAMAVIGPMIAPLAGALILKYFSWRATFAALVLVGCLCLIASLLLCETLDKKYRYEGTVLGSITRLFVVARNKGFTVFLFIASLLAAPYMAYIAVCSYIYIDYFMLSQQTYSYFFAFNSAFAVLGPLLYIKTVNKIPPKKFTALLFAVSLISGLLLVFLGGLSPWIFMISFLPFTLIESAIRPFSTSILLNQQEGDTGSASALINFTQTLLGCAGMLLGALPWNNFIIALGVIVIGFSLLAVCGWIYLLKSKLEVKGIK